MNVNHSLNYIPIPFTVLQPHRAQLPFLYHVLTQERIFTISSQRFDLKTHRRVPYVSLKHLCAFWVIFGGFYLKYNESFACSQLEPSQAASVLRSFRKA